MWPVCAFAELLLDGLREAGERHTTADNARAARNHRGATWRRGVSHKHTNRVIRPPRINWWSIYSTFDKGQLVKWNRGLENLVAIANGCQWFVVAAHSIADSLADRKRFPIGTTGPLGTSSGASGYL